MACRICTSNDRETLVEDIARDFWEAERGGTIDDRYWDDAGPYWQDVFRHFAERALVTMERGCR